MALKLKTQSSEEPVKKAKIKVTKPDMTKEEATPAPSGFLKKGKAAKKALIEEMYLAIVLAPDPDF